MISYEIVFIDNKVKLEVYKCDF